MIYIHVLQESNKLDTSPVGFKLASVYQPDPNEKVTESEHFANICHHLQHAAWSSPFPTFFDALALRHCGGELMGPIKFGTNPWLAQYIPQSQSFHAGFNEAKSQFVH